MKKNEEILNGNSCLNRAFPEEMLFILLGRDKAAPNTIRFWAKERVRLGKNRQSDRQIIEALFCAQKMEESQ